jgi:hypothetical protein
MRVDEAPGMMDRYGAQVGVEEELGREVGLVAGAEDRH